MIGGWSLGSCGLSASASMETVDNFPKKRPTAYRRIQELTLRPTLNNDPRVAPPGAIRLVVCSGRRGDLTVAKFLIRRSPAVIFSSLPSSSLPHTRNRPMAAARLRVSCVRQGLARGREKGGRAELAEEKVTANRRLSAAASFSVFFPFLALRALPISPSLWLPTLTNHRLATAGERGEKWEEEMDTEKGGRSSFLLRVGGPTAPGCLVLASKERRSEQDNQRGGKGKDDSRRRWLGLDDSSSCPSLAKAWRVRKKTHASSPSTSGKTHEKTCPIQTRLKTATSKPNHRESETNKCITKRQANMKSKEAEKLKLEEI